MLCREIEWVIGHRMASQLEKLNVLEESKISADRERELEASKAALLRSVSKDMCFIFNHLNVFSFIF